MTPYTFKEVAIAPDVVADVFLADFLADQLQFLVLSILRIMGLDNDAKMILSHQGFTGVLVD